MTIEKIKGILAQLGITVAQTTEGVLWTFKMTPPLNTPLEKGVEALSKAGYTIENSGSAGDGGYEYIRIINPAHAEKKAQTTKTITIDIPDAPAEIETEPVVEIPTPELDSSGTEGIDIENTISTEEEIPEEVEDIANEL